MSEATLPPRPRLAAHVLARRHVVDGEERVILHDQDGGTVLQIGRREWGILEAADGTRGVEGIVVAARRAGAYARVAAVRELLEGLAARGMIEPGAAAEPVAGASPGQAGVRREPGDAAPQASRARAKPLVGVPDVELRCSGAGTCCRLYGTVIMTPEELRRVQTLLPRWRVGPVPPDRWGTPVEGSEPGPLVASVARDGACGFLRGDGRCEVHRVGGAPAKPHGCRAFPRIYVDDGEVVRVSLKPECPCVLAPTSGDIEPLLDPAAVDVDGLPPEAVVDALRDAIVMRPGRAVSRAALRSWYAELAVRPVPADPAAFAWALADRMDGDGLPTLDAALWRAGPPDASAVRPWMSALHRRALERAREHTAWRSESDLVRRTSVSLALLTRLLLEPAALSEALAAPTPHRRDEERHWRLGRHDYRWARRGELRRSLRDEAMRLWLARSLPAVLSEGAGEDPDLRAPLALVEAMLRAHGVGVYVDDVDPA